MGFLGTDPQVAATLFFLSQAQGCLLVGCTAACSSSAITIEGRVLQICPPPSPRKAPVRESVLGLLLTDGSGPTGICFSFNENFCGKKPTYLSVSESWTSFH